MHSPENSYLDLCKLADFAIRCVGVDINTVERNALIAHLKIAVSETPYALEERRMLIDMCKFSSGFSLETGNGRQVLGICRKENLFWVGGHEYLIGTLVAMLFSLMERTDKDGRERAASVFSLVGHAIRRQA